MTQPFNTTTSMGRLTLNVLLSFAQFERELTGERIRDKIAASKKKGIWVGGAVPLGYAPVKDKKLVLVPAEAETVRAVRLSQMARIRVHLIRRRFPRATLAQPLLHRRNCLSRRPTRWR